MRQTTKRAILLAASILLTFIFLRVSLYISPNANFDVAGFNIHHLFTGIIVLSFAIVPLLLTECKTGLSDALIIIFGIGLSMALDEWVYLIATDGSDAAYLTPVSFWGGVIVTGLVILYILGIWLFTRRCQK